MRSRLAVFAALMVVLLLVLGGVAAWNSERAATAVQVQAQSVEPAQAANQDLAISLRSADRALNSYLMLREAGGEAGPVDEHLLAPWREMAASVRSDIGRVSHLTSQPPFDRPELTHDVASQVSSMRESMLAWTQATSSVAQVQPGQPVPPQPSNEEIERWSALLDIAVSDNTRLQTSLEAVDVTLRQEIQSTLRSSLTLMVVLTIVAVVLAMFIAWRTTQGLVKPVAMLGDTVRRQVNGERHAWANTEVGASEIRRLAVDVNHLNREHVRLVDRQAQSIALLRAGNDTVALIRRAADMNDAAQVAADALGQTLGVDGVRLAGWSKEAPFAAVWSRTSTARFQVPELWWQRLAQNMGDRVPYRVVRVHDRGRHSDVDETPSWIAEDPVVASAASTVFLPMLVGQEVVGIIALNAWSDEREWDETEIAYMERISRELTRVAMGLQDV